ncbi:MAG TPA: nicotinate-nucleotide--dimethylbenzimidazole phosphoribosyltransferase [Amaricoccus sp.]|nr:nicotinate-nucleotide--dimethylbenzimidazole phosphoribosyltransferase [Amaricoccus sp.]
MDHPPPPLRMTDPGFEAALRHRIDSKTKPLGALGRIEDLAAAIARTQRTLTPRMERCQLTIFAGDHGLAREGVSAYPQEVTRQMLLTFLAGNAAANVFARTTGAALRLVDAGVAGPPISHPDLLSRRLGDGTANALSAPAMSREICERALALGRALGEDGAWDAVAFGEMGIANTSAAALVAHKAAGLPLASLVGRGTGLGDPGLARKRAVLARAAARTPPRLAPAEALAEFGGFEMAMMAGAMLGAAAARRVVLVDGFIAGAVALVATRIEPAAREALVFAHRSAEAGHAAVLGELGALPLLDLGMRLGEGTGALLAWPLVRAAAAMLSEMASFESAGISGPA